MKKIDLHIHTISTKKDVLFEFSMEKLKEYVISSQLDCIAISNHNMFEMEQFNEIINENIGCVVFPGVEVDLEGGHILVIADNNDLVDFSDRCKKLEFLNDDVESSISFNDFSSIFTDFDKYLFIPHYKKDPIIKDEIINKFEKHVFVGEVSNPKKFTILQKDPNSLVPAIFSDVRISIKSTCFPLNQMFVDLEDINLSSLKYALSDKSKVSTSRDNSKLFTILHDGTKASDGLNVVLGKRSSGKTVTLNKIANTFSNVKYIKQFALLETDEEKSKKEFNNRISKNESEVAELFLEEFKKITSLVDNIDLTENDKILNEYVDSLHKAANHAEKLDNYSRTKMYNEDLFEINEDKELDGLIKNVESLLDAKTYNEILYKYISRNTLVKLLLELLTVKKKREFDIILRTYANSIVSEIRRILKSKSSTPQILDANLSNISISNEYIRKFNIISNCIKRPRRIQEFEMYGFKIVIDVRPISLAEDLKRISQKKQGKFKDQLKLYDKPYEYLKSLYINLPIEKADAYKYFCFVEYRILNKYGFDVSGGERSEFNLIQELTDAYKYDLVLIDEPESSFDNIFIRDTVNDLIKDLSNKMPVFVVTHNNTIGATIKPNYIIYTERIINEDTGEATFEVYSGYASDLKLKSTNGKEIDNYTIIIDSLEAGQKSYEERGDIYKTIKNI